MRWLLHNIVIIIGNTNSNPWNDGVPTLLGLSFYYDGLNAQLTITMAREILHELEHISVQHLQPHTMLSSLYRQDVAQQSRIRFSETGLRLEQVVGLQNDFVRAVGCITSGGMGSALRNAIDVANHQVVPYRTICLWITSRMAHVFAQRGSATRS